MSKIAAAFQKHPKAFVPFITSGDPDLATTQKLIVAMAEAGATVVELGIPFSDPVADGPVVEAASARAIELGISLGWLLDELKKLVESGQMEVREKEELMKEPVKIAAALENFLEQELRNLARLALLER